MTQLDYAPFHYESAMGGAKSPAEMELSGLDRSLLDIAGDGTKPPIHFLTGLRPTEVEPGRMTFTIPATDWLRSARGEVSSTALSFLADAPVGGAIMTALPPRTAIPTVELSLVYLQPAPPGVDELLGAGHLISRDEITAVSHVDIHAGDLLLAIGSTRVVIEPTLALVPDTTANEPQEPEPYRQPVLGEAVSDDIWRSSSGLDVLIAQTAGDLPLPPIAWLLGLRPTEAQEGVISGQVLASGWVASPAGTAYGGFVAAALEWALSGAAQTMTAAGGRERMLDLKVNYLRPLIPQGQMLEVEARLNHRGRRIVAGEAAISREDGQVIAQAVGTARLD